MITDRKMNRFNDILHNNAVHKKHREWNIFSPYSYRGCVNRILKVANATNHDYTVKYINGSLQKTYKPSRRNRSRQKK